MMMTTWLIFTYQESWPFHPLPPQVALVLPARFTALQIHVQKHTDQEAEQVQQQFMERMMLRSSRCYLRLLIKVFIFNFATHTVGLNELIYIWSIKLNNVVLCRPISCKLRAP